MDVVLKLAVVGLLILIGAVFVAAEFALVAADRSVFEQGALAGNRGDARAASVLRRLSFHLGGTQLGVTVISLSLGFLADPAVASALDPLVEPWAGGASHSVTVVVALVITTIVSMVIGELIPKAIAINRAQATARRLAPLINAYGIAFGPVIRLLNRAAAGTVRKMGIEPREELATARNLEELMIVIETAAVGGELDPTSRELLERSIRFGDKTAASALVSRVSVTALQAQSTVADLAAVAARTGYSRFPIYGEDLDEILGVVHAKRCFEVPYEARATTPVTSVMGDPFVIPETRDLDSLILEMGARGVHLAIVIDEYGGTAGIITIEDVLEEIVGEIGDEHDLRTPRMVHRVGGEFLVAANLHADEVREATGFEPPDGDYETLAGFVLERLGHIPAVGEQFTHAGWTIAVTAADRVKIVELRLTPPQGELADS